MHSDKSAANICKLKQCCSQQPSCLPYIVLDDMLLVINCNVICECSVTATREGSPLMQLKPPATQILKALLLQQRRRNRPLGISDHLSHKICNSLSEMNSSFQFDLARSSGHSEGCHHIRLLEPRVKAVRQILRSGMPNTNRLDFTKFLFQLLFSRFCSQQPSCLAYIALDDRSTVRV